MSKNDVPKFLSISSIVIPAANTGNDNNSKKDVIYIDQTNNGILFIVIPGALPLVIVTIKLIELPSDAKPAKCKLNIAKSTEGE